MPGFELLRYDDEAGLAQAATDEWLSLVETASRQKRPQFVALSGGRIARSFFSAVTAASKARMVSLANVHFFWADERCVPPDHVDSNFALAEKFLLSPLEISPARIHRIHGEDPPEEAARAAEMDICRVVPCAKGQPLLDIVFLGMGEDGHVASLFPGSQDFTGLHGDNVYQPVTAPKPPPQRITISYSAIGAARAVWVLASGIGKEEALQKSLSMGIETPLGRVLSLSPATRIFTNINLPQTRAD